MINQSYVLIKSKGSHLDGTLSENLICSICSNGLGNNFQGSNGHCFCRSCIAFSTKCDVSTKYNTDQVDTNTRVDIDELIDDKETDDLSGLLVDVDNFIKYCEWLAEDLLSTSTAASVISVVSQEQPLELTSEIFSSDSNNIENVSPNASIQTTSLTKSLTDYTNPGNGVMESIMLEKHRDCFLSPSTESLLGKWFDENPADNTSDLFHSLVTEPNDILDSDDRGMCVHVACEINWRDLLSLTASDLGGKTVTDNCKMHTPLSKTLFNKRGLNFLSAIKIAKTKTGGVNRYHMSAMNYHSRAKNIEWTASLYILSPYSNVESADFELPPHVSLVSSIGCGACDENEMSGYVKNRKIRVLMTYYLRSKKKIEQYSSSSKRR